MGWIDFFRIGPKERHRSGLKCIAKKSCKLGMVDGAKSNIRRLLSASFPFNKSGGKFGI